MEKKITIREFTGFKTLKDAFISMLSEMADLVSKNFSNQKEKEKWMEQCWNDYGDDVAEFLWGTLDQDYTEDSDAGEDDDLIDYCDMYDLCKAMKANSESFFGYDVLEYLEK